ncbi:MAG: hypothetical protein FJX67_03100 [Alphaproteobacteria bacterium]|nr:hypothetical protein [Alphaproteobacteria bacterium]
MSMRFRLVAALLLGVLCAAGVATFVPYSLWNMPLPDGWPPTPSVMAGVAAATLVVMAAAAYLGLALAQRIGFAPFPSLTSEPSDGESGRARVFRAIGAGLVAGVLAAIAYEIVSWSDDTPELDPAAPVAERSIRILGGIVFASIHEEVLMRLFLVTTIVWALSMPARRRGSGVPAWCWWVAIIAAAPGCLPLLVVIEGMIRPLTTAYVVASVAIHAGLGIVFGCEYRRRGLEGSILAQAGAQLVFLIAARF